MQREASETDFAYGLAPFWVQHPTLSNLVQKQTR